MTLFDWLNELTFNKREWSSFSEDQRESFNSYMIHRYVSMYIDYVELANVAQKLPLTEKEKIYNIYKTMLPKKKMFLKYVKKQTKNTYEDLLKYVSEYYQCSFGEAEEYIDIIREVGIRGILWEMGVDEKETDKLIKKAKL
jgi:hypothetical protein